MRKEFEGEIATLQDHPTPISPGFDETQCPVKLKGLLEVAGGKIRGSKIAHLRTPRFVLSEQGRERAAKRHSSRKDTPAKTATMDHTILGLIFNTRVSERRNTVPATRKSGPVIPQCKVRFLSQLAPQPIATARQIVAAEDA